MKEYKCIIAGSRSFVDTQFAFDALDALDFKIVEVISGGAKGSDAIGEEWARQRGIPVKRFLPDWDRYGKAAGPMRNEAMAAYAAEISEYAGALVCFWNGESPGSKNMVSVAIKAGLKIVLPC
jgi:hypothetical protein